VTVVLRIESGWEDQLDSVINDTIMGVTRAVCADSKSVCPVDTGALQASLAPTNPEPKVGHVGSDLAYCATVELGFDGDVQVHAYLRQGHPVRAHIRHARSPEQPFLRPSLYRTRDLTGL